MTLSQERERRDPATLIGSGKIEEIADAVREHGLTAVVFNEDLTPSQLQNLQERIPAKIIDRTRLILDIFAQRARTREGKMQVELAQLNYLLPRITEKFGRFEQQTGGIGTRGPGERKLEVSQRRMRDRISRLRGDMEAIRTQRNLHRAHREGGPLPLVALVGYTNAGKSTLLNALHGTQGTQVYADDKLGATLDPTTRRVKLKSGRPSLFVDTVGFIQKLPTHLVAAFRATLEEVRDADVLVHVTDASDLNAPEQFKVVEDVVKNLEAEKVPSLVLFNKADRLTSVQRDNHLRLGHLLVSAKTGEGLQTLLEQVEGVLDSSLTEHEVLLPHDRRDLVHRLYETGHVLEEKSVARGVRLRVRVDDKNWGFVEKELKKII